jgi:hypothetical protein
MSKKIKEVKLKGSTDEVNIAFNHVREFYPSVIGVVFNKNKAWFYYDENFVGPSFDSRIDVGILEDAADSLIEYPCMFEI